jgi:MFS family permease
VTVHVLARYPDFRRLFVGNSVSLLGSSVTTVALPLTAVVYLRASPLQLGLLGALALVPHLALGLPVGVWVDRLPYRRLLAVAEFAQVPLIGAVPVLAALGVLALWQVAVVVVLAGAANVFEAVAAQSFTPTLVPRPRLLAANSALMASNATVSTAGAAVAGALVAVVAAPIATAVDALSFLVAGLCTLRISVPGHPPRARVHRRLVAEIRDGLRAVVGQPIVRAITAAATLGAIASQMQNVVIVLYLVRSLRLSATLVGVAMTVAGAAGVLTALVAGRITRRLGPGPAFIAGMLCAAVAGPVLVLAGGPAPVVLAVVAVAQVLRGSGPALYGVNQQTLRQVSVAPALLSRVNATWRFLVYGGQPIGALLGGLLGSVDPRLALVVGGAILLAATGVAAGSPLRARHGLPAVTG